MPTAFLSRPGRVLLRALALLLTCALAGIPVARADSYTYDELGNVQSITTPRGVRSYTYDEVDRLDTETGFTGSRNHAYDVNGNRTTDAASAPGTPTTATYTSNTNRIVTINGAAVSLDAAGQITNDGLNSYTWDDAGRLKSVSRAGQLRATYHHDHKHRRTRKVSTAAAPQGAKTIVYHYDDRDRLMAETSDTGVPIRSYAWADENLISQVEYAPNATSTGYDIARILYFELDQLGTPRQARERVGTIVWRWESDGYGTTPANEDPDGNGQPTTVNLRFPGQYYDEESGLHYNWHRYYVPRLGRYLSSDPIGIDGGANTYLYAYASPNRNIDPDGRLVVVLPAIPAIGTWLAANTANIGIGIGIGVLMSTPGDTPSAKPRTVPYPERKRGKYSCICRANKDGRSADNCSIEDQDFAMGYGEGSTLSEAKKAAEKNAKEKLGAKSTHHVQCRCTSPNGDRVIPHG
jgi:RHS repeat-associated protein